MIPFDWNCSLGVGEAGSRYRLCINAALSGWGFLLLHGATPRNTVLVVVGPFSRLSLGAPGRFVLNYAIWNQDAAPAKAGLPRLGGGRE